MYRPLFAGMALAGLLAVGGCAKSASCGEGEVLSSGDACLPASTSTTAPIDAATSDPAMEGDGGSKADTFGIECDDAETHAQCDGDADYCVIQPGLDVGYCSVTGCAEDPSVCPSGWTCFDISVFSPDLPSICQRP